MGVDLRVERNIRAHDRIARRYERIHGEIFNAVEQQRLRKHLEDAIASIETDSSPKLALDFGCGSGNLTAHLVDLNFRVTAADVSPRFLEMVRARYRDAALPVSLVQLNGHDLGSIEDRNFDLVATYSVLHHVPDYLAIVDEIARVIKPGGIGLSGS